MREFDALTLSFLLISIALALIVEKMIDSWKIREYNKKNKKN